MNGRTVAKLKMRYREAPVGLLSLITALLPDYECY
jgi:hypothetical protein